MNTSFNEEYYRFNEEDAMRFVTSTGKRASRVGDQLVFKTCPYCHGGKKPDRNTFSISMVTGQYECKRASCGVRGNMITLARDFPERFQLAKDVTNYYNIDNRKERYVSFKDAKREIEVRDPAIAYLDDRGISADVVKRYEITTKPDDDKVLVFPFKDDEGALQFVKYRNIDPDRTGMKEWCIKDKEDLKYKKILFGMKQCEDFGTLVITEGQIDSLSLAEAGIKNAVSVPLGKNGFTWIPNVWDWFVKFDELVVFGDNENGEVTLARELSQRFPKRVRIVQNEDYHGHKDANEILQKLGAEYLIKAVENAKPVVSFRIKKLSDVESVDLEKIEAFPTKINQLDDVIGRGFHFGEVAILTGKCGEGKSTLASQIVARMIQNGLKCFCYSGELPDYMFKAWLNYQIYGRKSFKDGEINALNEWYRDKCYIYDNSAVIDEKEELFDIMKQACIDLGCRFFLIDNLMTAMEDKPSEDLFRQQSRFLNRLTKFAKGFNCIVLLVAHPKKGDSDSNDSISGSGDITNRANLVIRFERKSKKKEDENISLIKITKNRTTGRLNWDGIEVRYIPENMRIIECKEDRFIEFLDKPEDVPFREVEEEEYIPF